jgi:hypothetical protein
MFGSYESWLDVMGGVLAVAGIDGLLTNRESITGRGDDELNQWRLFIHLWQEAVARNEIPQEAAAHQLLDMAVSAGLEVEAMGFQSQVKRLGKALSKIEGRVIAAVSGAVRIRSRLLTGRRLYRIEG